MKEEKSTPKWVGAAIVDLAFAGIIFLGLALIIFGVSQYAAQLYDNPAIGMGYTDALPFAVSGFFFARLVKLLGEILDNPTAAAMDRRNNEKEKEE